MSLIPFQTKQDNFLKRCYKSGAFDFSKYNYLPNSIETNKREACRELFFSLNENLNLLALRFTLSPEEEEEKETETLVTKTLAQMTSRACSFMVTAGGYYMFISNIILTWLSIWHKQLGLPPFFVIGVDDDSVEYTKLIYIDFLKKAFKISEKTDQRPVVLLLRLIECRHAISCVFSYHDGTWVMTLIDTSNVTAAGEPCHKYFQDMMKRLSPGIPSHTKHVLCAQNMQGNTGTCVSMSLGLTFYRLKTIDMDPENFSYICLEMALYRENHPSAYNRFLYNAIGTVWKSVGGIFYHQVWKPLQKTHPNALFEGLIDILSQRSKAFYAQREDWKYELVVIRNAFSMFELPEVHSFYRLVEGDSPTLSDKKKAERYFDRFSNFLDTYSYFLGKINVDTWEIARTGFVNFWRKKFKMALRDFKRIVRDEPEHTLASLIRESKESGDSGADITLVETYGEEYEEDPDLTETDD